MSNFDLIERGLCFGYGVYFTELESLFVIRANSPISDTIKRRDTLAIIKEKYGQDKYNTIFDLVDWKKPTIEKMEERVNEILWTKPGIPEDELIEENLEDGEDFEEVTENDENDDEIEDWDDFVDVDEENEAENGEIDDLSDDNSEEDKLQGEEEENNADEGETEEIEEEEMVFENEEEEREFLITELRNIKVLVGNNWSTETLRKKYDEKISSK